MVYDNMEEINNEKGKERTTFNFRREASGWSLVHGDEAKHGSRIIDTLRTAYCISIDIVLHHCCTYMHV